MRAVARIAIGLLALLACVAGGLYLALPWLLGPTTAAPASSAPGAAGALLSTLRGGAGSAETVRLNGSQLDELLALTAGGGQGPLTAVWATLGPGTVDLYVDATVPQSVAVPRLRGRDVGLELTVAPRASANGTLTLTVRRVRVGRLPLEALLPLSRVVPAMARLVSSGRHTWWSVRGSSLIIDVAAAPPLAVGPTLVRAVPTALTVTPTALTITGEAQVHLTLPAEQLGGALAGALVARQDSGVIPLLNFQAGRAVLTLIGPGSTRQFALGADVPQPGVLRVAVAGSGANPADAVAQLLTAALGATPSWLAVDAGGLTVDWRRMAGIDVGGGVRLRFLPQSVQVGPSGVSVWTAVLPA